MISGWRQMTKEKFCLALISCPDEEQATAIQRALVFERLAACVSLVPGVLSCYRWEGRIEENREFLLVAKTRRARFKALKERVLQLHPDQVPEIVLVSLEDGEERYLAWLAENT